MPEFKEDEIFQVKIPLTKQKEKREEGINIQELRNLILEFIRQSNGRDRQEINNYIYPLLNEAEEIMNNRVRTTLTYLKRKGLIINIGTDKISMWIFCR